MFAAILAFFSGSNFFSGILKYVIVIGGALAAVMIWLSIHDAAIRKADLDNFNAKEQKIIAEQQALFDAQNKKLSDIQNQIEEDLKKQQSDVSDKIKGIEDNLNKIDPKKTGEILRETLKELQQQFGH